MDQKLEHNQGLWTAYRHDLRIRDASPETIRNYFESLDRADKYFKAPFTGLTKFDIKGYIAQLLDLGLKRTTIETNYVGLRVFFNWMVREELIPTSPIKGVDCPEVPDVPPAIPQVSDIKALLKACSGTDFRSRRDNALFRLMIEPGGTRRLEVIRLELEAVDTENDIIRVLGKGGKTRFITYGARTGQALFRYLNVRENHKYAHTDALWLGRYGPLGKFALAQILKNRCAQAGIQKINPHALRHFSADQAMAAGMTEQDLMTLFGWSTRRMVDVYGRANKTNRALASAKLLALGDKL
jgi:site-specific recombinase XerD